MTTSELILKLRNDVRLLKERPLALAAASVHAMVAERIFEKGQNANDVGIGTYNDSDELYVNPKYSPKKFPTKGKTGKSKFKNGKAHKTGFFKSYKSFKKTIGRQSNFVNLNLTGLLQRDFTNSLQKSGEHWISGVKNKANVGKVEGAEDKYKNIFKLSKKESAELKRIASAEAKKILNA